MKPLVFLDVDGVLNRDVSRSQARKRGYLIKQANTNSGRFRLMLDFEDRNRLQRLKSSVDLAWGTTWEHEANRHLTPFLHIEDLPVAKREGEDYSKVEGVARLARARPFAWLDDEFQKHDRNFVESLPNSTLLLDVDPHFGLTDSHVDQVLEWAKGVRKN